MLTKLDIRNFIDFFMGIALEVKTINNHQQILVVTVAEIFLNHFEKIAAKKQLAISNNTGFQMFAFMFAHYLCQ